MKQKERQKAREVLQTVLSQYPDSAFVVPARKFLLEIAELEAQTSRLN
jgi:TolA-binding protein